MEIDFSFTVSVPDDLDDDAAIEVAREKLRQMNGYQVEQGAEVRDIFPTLEVTDGR